MEQRFEFCALQVYKCSIVKVHKHNKIFSFASLLAMKKGFLGSSCKSSASTKKLFFTSGNQLVHKTIILQSDNHHPVSSHKCHRLPWSQHTVVSGLFIQGGKWLSLYPVVAICAALLGSQLLVSIAMLVSM